MGYRRGYYRKDGSYVQGHTINSGKKRTVYSGKKKGCLGVVVLLALCTLYYSCSDSSDCDKKTCADFTSQSQAQSTYNSDTDCYDNLDADNDGIACENLSN